MNERLTPQRYRSVLREHLRGRLLERTLDRSDRQFTVSRTNRRTLMNMSGGTSGGAIDAAPAAKRGEYSVLVVDDEPHILAATATFLTRRGYNASVARSAREAIRLLGEDRFHAMICDVSMPETSGLDLIPRARLMDAELAIVMLSGVDSAVTANQALQRGATEYLVKPAALADLEAALGRALQQREEAAARRRTSRARRARLALEGDEAARERARLESRMTGLVEALIFAMEAKDVYIRGRSDRVAEIAGAIAEELELEPEVVEDVRLAARLHDVGMLGILESVLQKPTALTEEEYEHVKDHVRIGMEILSPLEHLGAVLDYVQDHHERWDGTGYPRRIAGESISIGGRILAAADAFDTLTSGRSFRRVVGSEEALKTIGYVVGSLLEPRVYEALCAVVRRGGVGRAPEQATVG